MIVCNGCLNNSSLPHISPRWPIHPTTSNWNHTDEWRDQLAGHRAQCRFYYNEDRTPQVYRFSLTHSSDYTVPRHPPIWPVRIRSDRRTCGARLCCANANNLRYLLMLVCLLVVTLYLTIVAGDYCDLNTLTVCVQGGHPSNLFKVRLVR